MRKLLTTLNAMVKTDKLWGINRFTALDLKNFTQHFSGTSGLNWYGLA